MELEAFITMYLSEILLLLAGLIGFVIIHTYRKDDESFSYRFSMLLGLIVSIALIIIAIPSFNEWTTFTTVAVILLAFALLIRPFREVNFAAIVSFMIMVLIYVLLGDIDTTANEALAFLNDFWPKAIIAFVGGAIVYMLLNFVQSIVQMFGKLFNWWPFLFILSLICIIEALCLIFNLGSVYDIVQKYLEPEIVENIIFQLNFI